MDLPEIITHLKANVLPFSGRVAGLAEFNETMAGELRPRDWPAAYVVPLGAESQPNDASNALYQITTERLGIIVEFNNEADRRGQGVTLLYKPVRIALYGALLNWRGTDRAHALRGFEAASEGVLQSDRARVFYQFEFTIETVLTDADGWQEPALPLVQILANAEAPAANPAGFGEAPGGAAPPPPAFSVNLPQP